MGEERKEKEERSLPLTLKREYGVFLNLLQYLSPLTLKVHSVHSEFWCINDKKIGTDELSKYEPLEISL